MSEIQNSEKTIIRKFGFSRQKYAEFSSSFQSKVVDIMPHKFLVKNLDF